MLTFGKGVGIKSGSQTTNMKKTCRAGGKSRSDSGHSALILAQSLVILKKEALLYMANLTYTAYLTRKLIKYGSFALALLLISRVALGIITNYFRQVHPPPPPPPTVAYGRLPTLSFPKKENLPALNFKLETIDGTLPKLPDTAKVYFLYQPTANLLALDRAKELANKVGFQNEPVKISDRVYRFTGQDPTSSLEMDIISQKFKLSYAFANDQTIFSEKKLPNNDQAVSEAKSFLSRAGILDASLENGQAKVSYLKYEAPDLVPAISLSEADFVQVDLFPENLDDLKILPPNPNHTLVSLIFSGARDQQKRIVEVNYLPLLLTQDNFATYPLKTPAAAWAELLAGGGFVASLENSGESRIAVPIRRIYLAYYQSDVQQNFLQPIFVFEGDPDFTAYVQAVDPKWNE